LVPPDITSDAQHAGALPWQRDVVYDMPLKSRLGPSHAHNVVSQTLRTFHGAGWSVHESAVTPNVPLGATFVTRINYEARQLGANVTELHVSGELVFKSGAFGPLRGTIAAAWHKGTAKTYGVTRALLLEAFPEAVPGAVPDNMVHAMIVTEPAANGKANGTVRFLLLPMHAVQQVVHPCLVQHHAHVGLLRLVCKWPIRWFVLHRW
jgi:VAD1 Analog of StAR-related lipid transfer domain